MSKQTVPQFHNGLLHPRYWLTWLGLGIGWLVAQLPFGIQMQIGKFLGWLMKKTSARRRHIAQTNLTLCFPEKSERQRNDILDRNFESLGIAIMETCISWFQPISRLKHRIQIEGLEYLEKASAENKGVILLGAHYTTLEIAGKLLDPFADFDALYRQHKNPVFDYVMYISRLRYCKDVIERGNMRAMIRSLKKGNTIWYAPDQNYGAEHSVFVTFFNIPAATITATSRLATMTKSPVVPFSHQRINNREYLLRIHPPLQDFPSGDDIEDTQRINHWIEDQVRQMPEQYLWTHRRFKTRPEGEASLY